MQAVAREVNKAQSSVAPKREVVGQCSIVNKRGKFIFTTLYPRDFNPKISEKRFEIFDPFNQSKIGEILKKGRFEILIPEGQNKISEVSAKDGSEWMVTLMQGVIWEENEHILGNLSPLI